jgi:uncharacterized damage-inducible protein DinB
MSEILFIVDQLKRAFDGEAWHGPALMEILDDVSARTASARPLANGHTIWALVLHVAAWEQVVTRRLAGQATTLSDAQNFGHVERESDEAWGAAVESLRQNHSELVRAVEILPESRLNDRVPGKDYDLRFMLHGAVQHAVYHGGQIALLKRARG